VVLSADGYLLTAAHCVSGTVSLAFSDGSKIPGAARVVYLGNPSDASRDMAVLKIQAKRLTPLMWAGDDEVSRGAAVLAAGCCPVNANKPVTAAAGVIRTPLSKQDLIDGHPSQTLTIDAPIGRGDSGGPLVTRAGRLIGINRSIEVPLHVMQAVRPDPAWIHELIDADRVTHPSTLPAK
jgi:serine protease Do